MPNLIRSRLFLWLLVSLTVNNQVQAGQGFTCQYEEEEADQRAVTEIKYTRSKAPKAEVTKPIEHRMRKHITCGGSRGCKRPPLPMIVLTA